MIVNCGIAASCVGTTKVASRIPKSTLLPGNLYFAKVNAASESKNSTSTVVTIGDDQRAEQRTEEVDPREHLADVARTGGPPKTSLGGAA